jgi:hypothetical protein
MKSDRTAHFAQYSHGPSPESATYAMHVIVSVAPFILLLDFVDDVNDNFISKEERNYFDDFPADDVFLQELDIPAFNVADDWMRDDKDDQIDFEHDDFFASMGDDLPPVVPGFDDAVRAYIRESEDVPLLAFSVVEHSCKRLICTLLSILVVV